MGTRAIFTFKDDDGEFHVFKHWDGYPSGAAEALDATLQSGKTWALPRFEADEFACGFIAANKHKPGGYRIVKSKSAIWGCEYRYTVTATEDGLQVQVFKNSWSAAYDRPEKFKKIWTGPLADLEFLVEE